MPRAGRWQTSSRAAAGCAATELPLPSLPSVQALAIREMGSYVCELKRVGTGHGVFHFDERIDSL